MTYRIQRRRTKGWRAPEDAQYVGRGSRWGNPFVIAPAASRRGGLLDIPVTNQMTGPEDPSWRWEFRCEDFVYARLADAQTAAEQMPPGDARDTELGRIDSLYLIAADHNIWVDSRGQSAGRCITCTISGSGVPCQTMRGLARLYRTHPDYNPAWNQNIDAPNADSATYKEYKQRTTIYQRRAAELLPWYDRFDLEHDRDGEYWQCRTCPARGESYRPLLPGGYDHPYGIDDARKQHPACPAIETKEPTTCAP